MSEITKYEHVGAEDPGVTLGGDIELGYADSPNKKYTENVDHADEKVGEPGQEKFFHSIFKIVVPDIHKEYFEKNWLPQILSAASQFKV